MFCVPNDEISPTLVYADGTIFCASLLKTGPAIIVTGIAIIIPNNKT